MEKLKIGKRAMLRHSFFYVCGAVKYNYPDQYQACLKKQIHLRRQ